MKIFNRKITAVLLAAVMLAVMQIPAFAADSDLHVKYITGYPDGTVRPSGTLTHAEAVQILYNLKMTDSPAEEGFSESYPILRGDFAKLVMESDADLELSDILTGYPDGSLGLERKLTRAEAVTMINRALGRVCDTFVAKLSLDKRIMPDVPESHWAYAQFMEAATEHTFTMEDGEEIWQTHEPGTVTLSEGWYHYDGELYHVNSKGLYDFNTIVDGIYLDNDGRFTTKNVELDSLLTAEIKNIITAGMSHEEQLRAVYDYVMENYGYRGAANVETGTTGWETDIAIDMLKNKKGNCYSWAAAFTYLAQKIGYNASAIAGTATSPGGSVREHAWTEIVIDGTAYVCDPEIEAVYAKTAGETYDLYMKPYGTAVWQYDKPVISDTPDDDNTDQPIMDEEPDEELCAILDKVYEGVYEEGNEPELGRYALNSTNESFLLGATGLDYECGVASEAMISTVPHSVVLLKMKDGADIEAAKKAVAENADPQKWICVGVSEENVVVESVGNYIILIMDDNSQKFRENFLASMK
jgi:hypothetical protein